MKKNEQLKVTAELVSKAMKPEQVFGRLDGMTPGVGGFTIPVLFANLVIRVADIQEELGAREGAGRLWELLGVAIAKIRSGSYGGEEASGDWRDNMMIGNGSLWVGEVARERKRRIEVESMLAVRFPRLGDRCLVCTGMATLEGSVKDEADVIDVTTDGKRLRFAFGISDEKMRQCVEYDVVDYGKYWQYLGDKCSW